MAAIMRQIHSFGRRPIFWAAIVCQLLFCLCVLSAVVDVWSAIQVLFPLVFLFQIDTGLLSIWLVAAPCMIFTRGRTSAREWATLAVVVITVGFSVYANLLL